MSNFWIIIAMILISGVLYQYFLARRRIKNDHEYHQYYIKPNRISNMVNRTIRSGVDNSINNEENEINIQMALTQIKGTDPSFNESDFYEKVKKTFYKIQEAWTNQDIEIARPYATDAIIQRYIHQIDDLKSRGEKNVLDKIVINSICFRDVRNDHNYNYITVKIDADYNVNYIINEKKERRCANNNNKNVVEYWTFIRTIEKLKIKKVKKNKCSSCGAKLEVNASGKCDYCDATVTSEKYDWVLSQIDKSFSPRARWTPVLPKKSN